MDIFYKRWDASSSAWIMTEVVSTESTADSSSPSLAVDSAGNIHTSWEDQTDYDSCGPDEDIFYKRWDASTSSWTTTEVISTNSTEASDEPSIAVDAEENVHIAWYDGTDYAGSGTDRDIFYKLLTVSPAAPELAPILPNPTELSSISLVWNSINGAIEYYVYRSVSYIGSVEGLTPIATVGSTSYDDTLPSEGIYFYVIVASDGLRNSTHSNCEYVEYKLPTVHEFFILSSLIIGIPVFLFVVTRIRKKNSKLS